MTALRLAAQQALEALTEHGAAYLHHESIHQSAITALRAALKQEEEASAWLAERKEYWRKEKEKMKATNDLRAALAQQAEPKGGGNLPPPLQADPVAAVAENATTQQRVVETPPSDYRRGYWDGFNIGKREGRIEAEDALAQQADPTDPGHDVDVLREHVRHLERRVRELHAQQAEPVAVAERERIAAQWDGCVTHQLDTFGPVDIGASIRAGELVGPAQQAEPVEPVAWRYDLEQNGSFAGVSTEYSRIKLDKIGKNWTPLYTAPPQRKLVPLTEEEIEHIGMTHQSLRQVVRAAEKASWEKNHG